ncbi:MAG: diguanylate cyclase, partial [Leptonema sp. (in: Bacteria)]|nr:diguanylate cyclase [Leptonema sp. (in: bacteria)]
IRRSIRRNEPFRQELSISDGSDQPRWFDIHVVPHHNEKGKQTGAVAILLDITERKLVEEAMAFHAYHDTLTGLPNRRRLAERLRQIQLRAERLSEKYAVLFLDLDRFKEVNDTHGHRAGDLVLLEVANRIRSVLRKDDALCRQGGDEFIIVLPGIRHPADVINVAEKLITSLSQPIAVDDFVCRIGASIGISLFPEHDLRSDRLIQLADKALYKAKVRGRGGYAFVDEINSLTNKIMIPLRHKPITEVISIPESIHSELLNLMKQAGIDGKRLSLLIEN